MSSPFRETSTPSQFHLHCQLVSKEELRLIVIPPDASVQLHQPEPHDPGARSSRN
jgi:hypothetical protein